MRGRFYRRLAEREATDFARHSLYPLEYGSNSAARPLYGLLREGHKPDFDIGRRFRRYDPEIWIIPSPRRAEGGQTVPSGRDARRFSPAGKRVGSTVFGTEAIPRSSLDGRWLPVFSNVTNVCDQRRIRKEVMFAQHKAGKGYRVKRRRRWYTEVTCDA